MAACAHVTHLGRAGDFRGPFLHGFAFTLKLGHEFTRLLFKGCAGVVSPSVSSYLHHVFSIKLLGCLYNALRVTHN